VDIISTTADPLSLDGDLLAYGIGKDLAGLDALLPALGDGLKAYAKARAFTGSAGSALLIPGLGRTTATDVLLVGTGDGARTALRKAAAKAGREAREHRASSLILAIGAVEGELAAEAAIAGNYVFDRYKKEDDRTPRLTRLTLVGAKTAAASSVRAAWQDKARDLVNLPAAEIYPESLAQWARDQLGALPKVTVEVWDEHRCEAEGCVGIIAVGQGSARQPRMIRASYRSGKSKAHVALVGKGVTFDSGGLSIKPSSGMQTMRCDMGGAATMLAAFGAVAELGLPVDLDVWVAAAENMVDGNSYKLGDVLTYKNGVTVEIHNTDAEGRLVLADALIRACEVDGVTHLVDAATLTGACVVALGDDFTGLFTADDDLANSLLAASETAGEGMWRLPLHDDYKSLLKAKWGQIKNVGGRSAGATTAALYLKHFVDGPKWAHLDIAGSSFHDSDSSAYAAGATGAPVRTVIRWIEGMAAGK
jgi:leucyl aminopeptidase